MALNAVLPRSHCILEAGFSGCTARNSVDVVEGADLSGGVGPRSIGCHCVVESVEF